MLQQYRVTVVYSMPGNNNKYTEVLHPRANTADAAVQTSLLSLPIAARIERVSVELA